jgi:hypothetical protein
MESNEDIERNRKEFLLLSEESLKYCWMDGLLPVGKHEEGQLNITTAQLGTGANDIK